MRGGRTILAILSAALWGGCSSFQERWPWEERQVPVTAPKEQVKMPALSTAEGPPLSAVGDADANTAGRSAASGTRTGAGSGPRAAERRPATQMAGGPLTVPLPLTDLPDVPTPPVAPPSPPAPPPAPTLTRPPVPPHDPNPSQPGEVVGAFGLQVNNKYITVEDLLRSAAGELAELPKGLSERAFRDQAARILGRAVRTQTELAVFLPEAEAKMTEEDTKRIDDELDKTLRALVAEAGGSRTRLEQIWVQRGTTLDLVLKEHRSRLLVSRYLQSKMLPDIKITRRMLYDYYQRHKADRYTRGKKVQMQILAVPLAFFLLPADPTQAERDAARRQAREAIAAAEKALKGGGDFTETVKALGRDARHAQGGVWPLMEAGSYRDTKVEQAAFALREGETSGVIETDEGFSIVKALKVEAGSVVSFEDAQEEIEKTLTDEQYEKLHEKYVLAKSPNISSSAGLEELAMDKAVERYWRK